MQLEGASLESRVGVGEKVRSLLMPSYVNMITLEAKNYPMPFSKLEPADIVAAA